MFENTRNLTCLRFVAILLFVFVYFGPMSVEAETGVAASATSVVDLQRQAKNEILNSYSGKLIAGLFWLALLGLVSMITKITGKKLEVERDSESGFEVASKLKRITNFSIDFFIVLNGLSAIIAYAAVSFGWYSILINPWTTWIVLLVSYYLFFEGLFGWTPGKLITRTRVVDRGGTRAQFSRIIGRTLTRLVPFEIFSFGGDNALGWHDRWSNTMVVNVGFDPNIEDSEKNVGALIDEKVVQNTEANGAQMLSDSCTKALSEKQPKNLDQVLKVSIVTGVLIIAVSAFYYFVIALPEMRKQDFVFSMKQKCQSAGEKLYQSDVDSKGDSILFEPQYTYSVALNTCLYSGGRVEDKGVIKWVKDSFTNKEIASYIKVGKEELGLSMEEFGQKEKELFSE